MTGKKTMWNAVLSLGLIAGCGAQDGGPEVEHTANAITDGTAAGVQIRSSINTDRNKGAGMCMDVAGGNTSVGTPIVQYPCHGAPGWNQRFHLVLATIGFSGASYQIVMDYDKTKCVGVNIPASRWYAVANDLLVLKSCKTDGSAADSHTGNVVLDTLWRSPSDQTFSATPVHSVLQNAGSTSPGWMYPGAGLCVDVASGLNWDSLWMQLYLCHYSPNQFWDLTNF